MGRGRVEDRWITHLAWSDWQPAKDDSGACGSQSRLVRVALTQDIALSRLPLPLQSKRRSLTVHRPALSRSSSSSSLPQVSLRSTSRKRLRSQTSDL